MLWLILSPFTQSCINEYVAVDRTLEKSVVRPEGIVFTSAVIAACNFGGICGEA